MERAVRKETGAVAIDWGVRPAAARSVRRRARMDGFLRVW